MSLKCNMGKLHRISYILIGIALLSSLWIFTLTGWLRVGLPALGGLTFFAGLIGQ